MAYLCPYCNESLEYIGYEARSGVDISPDGEADFESVGDGEVYSNRYFCPKCDASLVSYEDFELI